MSHENSGKQPEAGGGEGPAVNRDQHVWWLIRRAPNQYECARCGVVVGDFDENDPTCPGPRQ